MKGPFKVIDTNRHVVEPSDLWDNRIEKPYTGSHAVQVDLGQGSVLVSGRPVVKPRPNVMAHRFYQEAYKDAIQAGFTAESNLRDMDKEGVDVAILLPTVGLYAIWSDHIEGGLAAAMCRAYNDWLGEYCQADPARLKGVALLPLQDPGAAVTELRRAVQDLGLVAGFMRPNPLVGRKLHDPAYDVLYGEAQSLEVPILVSEMGGSVPPPDWHRPVRRLLQPGGGAGPLRDDAGLPIVHGPQRPGAFPGAPGRLHRRRHRLGAVLARPRG